MTRSAPGTLAFNLKIEKTARANRKETKLRKKQSMVVRTQSNPPPEIRIDDEAESRGVTEDQIKLRAFPFSLANSAREWLFYLPPGSITTWADLFRLFLNRFFPASRAAELRREIVGIRQKDAKTLYEYWERFKKCVSCPQHGITEQSLLQYFYEGLKPIEMNMVDAASGGALVNMTPQPARDLISMMVANSQQFRANLEPPRRVHQLSNSTLEDKIDRLTNIMSSLVAEKAKPARMLREIFLGHHKGDTTLTQIPTTQDGGTTLTLVMGLIHNITSHSKIGSHNSHKIQQTLNFQKETKASIRELTTLIEKLSSQGKLPSQTEPNPRQNANAVTLRSGKIPRYAKFLKELCTNKRKLTGNEKVSVGENVFAVLQRKMPVKCKDRGMFAIPRKIGHLGIKKAMCDLGASIIVMSYSIYESLNTGFLTKTGVTIQLADRSIVYPQGVLEDVLVKVNGLIFPVDFYVIKMEEDNTPGSSDIFLGQPFLSTANTKIDVRSGTLTIEFDGEIIKFNVYGTISHPSEVLDVNRVDIIDSSVENTFEASYGDKSKMMFDDFESINKLLAPMNTKLLPPVVQAPDLKLKPLPEHLKCTFLENDEAIANLKWINPLEENMEPKKEAQG
ncbi:hypothetical protein CXB51_002213 [Gossypium anomalum]|uniref:Retrotransposon gag domain-containing protein n=1 Tax=Gossypium anomalum TaxID=47600 RepID=A0A8J6DB21_9ROSI|nr:hypothetical protein CXB51_002213 [Gossypium anomalum]